MDNFKEYFLYGEKTGCDFLEFFISKSKDLTLEVRGKKLEKVTEAGKQGLGVRVIKKNRQSLAYTTDFSKESIEKAIDDAVVMGDFLDEEPALSYLEDETFSGVLMEEELLKIVATKTEDKVDYLLKMEGEAKEALVESVLYEDSVYEQRIINSKGLDKMEKGAYCGSYMALAIEGETGDAYTYSSSIEEVFKKNIGKEAYDNAKEMLGAKTVKTGNYSVILDKKASMNFLGLLAHGFNGENIYKGKSLFGERQGEQIISPLISITDNGTLKGKLGSGFFDGDGVATQENHLIEKGVFKKGIYNLTMAKMSGNISTGNCSRGYSSFPSIAPTNLYIENGGSKRAAVEASLESGLIIKDLMGLHMANPITGDFSLGASGLIIEKGIVTGAFRGVTVSGNLLTFFSNVTEVCDDLTFELSKGSPSLLIENVIISGE